MRKILLVVIFLMALLAYGLPSGDYYVDVEVDEFEDFIHQYEINDTISGLIKGREFIYYSVFSNGRNWVFAVPEGNKYVILTGNTMSKAMVVDTVAATPILTWGMETLVNDAADMRPERSDKASSGERMVVFSAEGKIVFDNDCIRSYAGPASDTFNKNLKRLKYCMFWYTALRRFPKSFPAPETSVVH